MDLPTGAIIGTGSLRRTVQLKQLRPDLEYQFIQGNVDSRIHQMETGKYDAIILAAAGLKRMNMLDSATEIFEDDVMVPAVGQGILGIELIDKEGYILDLIKKVRVEETRIAANAERAYLIALGGGCNLPIAAHAVVNGEEMTITGVFANEEGSIFEKDSITGNIENKRTLARELAEKLKAAVDAKKKEPIADVVKEH